MTTPRLITYYNSAANAIPLAGIADQPYTDVIVAFLAPRSASDFSLIGWGGAFTSHLAHDVATLQAAGKRVLVSVGGGTFPSTAWRHYAQNVDSMVQQLVDFCTTHGCDGVDIDYEDDTGFTGGYDGIDFLARLSQKLSQQLPAGKNLVTHAPQTPFWDPSWYGAPYAKIWQQAGDAISWINNQFYSNAAWDATSALKVEWFEKVAALTGASKLALGLSLSRVPEGYQPLSELLPQVIAPLMSKYGTAWGGVMGWEFSIDTGGRWGRSVAHALGLTNS